MGKNVGLAEAIRGPQRIHKLAKLSFCFEIRRSSFHHHSEGGNYLTVIFIVVFFWGVHKGGSMDRPVQWSVDQVCRGVHGLRARLCSKENWRVSSTLNLRNLGCPAYDLSEKFEIFWLPKSKSWVPGATVLGSARAQLWVSVFSGHPAARLLSTIMIYIILEMITVNSTTTAVLLKMYQYTPYYVVANNNSMNLQNSLHLVNSAHCLPASLSILVRNSSFVNHPSLSTTVYFVPDKKETVY